MKKKSNSRFASRLMLLVLGSVLMLNAIILILIGIMMSRNTKQAGVDVAMARSYEISIEVSKFIEEAVVTARNISSSFIAIRKSMGSRENASFIMLEALKNNPEYSSIWTMWEPNAFDNRDSYYLYDSLYKQTNGSMNLMCYRDNDKTIIEKGSIDNYNEDFYLIPKKNQNVVLFEPYFRSYSGNEKDKVFETSVVVPVTVRGQFYGVVGININLQPLQQVIVSKSIFAHGFAAIISNELQLIAHPETEFTGKNIKQLKISRTDDVNSSIKEGNTFHYVDRKGINNALRCFSPVKIEGISSNPWSVMVEVPMKEVFAKSRSIILILLFIGLFSTAIIALMVYFISRNIARPILQSVEFAKKIAGGELDAGIEDYLRNDEIGVLINALRGMSAKLQEILTSISDGANNIADASAHLSETSQQLSLGANEQASSFEELSTTMEEMASNIQQNTENAQQAEKMSVHIRNGIHEVTERAKKAYDANKVISDKIKIINDIAFQTNILALNAAVEAARAGEHGKGFAVVAAEVRKLAEHSKQAADEIISLAETSLEFAEGAGSKLTELIPEIEKTTKLVQEIAAASLEQSNGTSQVNNAIQQLSNVTQQNAALSEELSTSAEEMSSQAEQLKSVIAYFKINRETSDVKKKSSVQKAGYEEQTQATAAKKQISRKKGSIEKYHERIDDNDFEKF